ncbi:MAG: tetratricopeptide repeat protein [Chitinophagales bacterium]
MDKKQLLLVGMGISLILLLYFGGSRKSSAIEGTDAVVADTLQQDEMLVQINFEKLANNLKKKIDSVQQDSIVLLETKMEAYKDSSNVSKASVYKELAKVWEKAQYIELASYYFQQAAKLDSVESRWKEAGEKLAFAFRVSGDSSMRAYLTESTLDAYNNASAFDTSNLDYQIELAATYIDGYGNQGQQVMKGVFMLRDITIKDSTNIKANLLLGQMAIVSAQYDKAVARLQIVISKNPSNAQAYYYLAEAYIGLGQKEKAIEAYKDCKKWVKNPTFADQLDKYIEDLINS